MGGGGSRREEGKGREEGGRRGGEGCGNMCRGLTEQMNTHTVGGRCW